MPNLRIPGPTPCPPDVLAALDQQMVNHRGPEFVSLLARVTDGMRPFFATQNPILVLTCSGTGVMEAAVVNTLSPGDAVLAVSIGSFGDRFASIAETYGATVTRLNFEWGQAADPGAVRDAVRTAQPKAVLLTHNETSTGVTNPLELISAAIRAESDALILVDAVSSLGCLPMQADAWGLDVVVTGSQKGWQVPPGLAMVSVSERAWEASAVAKMPRFYLDFAKHRDFADRSQTPFTPALSIFYGLDVALRRMTAEGTEATYARHASLGAHVRHALQGLGLELFADQRYASNTVTAVRVPAGVDGKTFSSLLREKYDTVVAGGQGKLAGQIFRLGHLGWVDQPDLDAAIDAVRSALTSLGVDIPSGAPAQR